MGDIWNTISSNYLTVGSATSTQSAYKPVDEKLYEGSWSGKYANNDRFSIQVSDVVGFRAKVRYESGTTVKYQDVLIRDNSFRIGDSKFMLTRAGTAQIKTVLTNPATGGQSLETAYAKQS